MKHVRLKAVGGGAALLALTACAGLPGRDAGQPAYAGDPAMQSVAQANTEFGLEILGQLDEPGKNIFLSPASLTTAFGLLRAGAAGTPAEGGSFLEEIQSLVKIRGKREVRVFP